MKSGEKSANRRFGRWTAACAAVVAVLFIAGCGGDGDAAPRPAAQTTVSTNVVEQIREVTVTNVVTVVVTNIVEEQANRVPSVRRTAPWRVSAKDLNPEQLRQLVSQAGGRVISCDAGSVALVEMSDRAAKELRTIAFASPLSPEEKIAADAGERVRIVPVSAIDVEQIAEAVRALGGRVMRVIATGKPAVRAKISYSSIRKLAARGDVRRIERDEK